jgi:hypothetical protein
MTLRWPCFTCGRRYWFTTLSCVPCQEDAYEMAVARALNAMTRIANAALMLRGEATGEMRRGESN